MRQDLCRDDLDARRSRPRRALVPRALPHHDRDIVSSEPSTPEDDVRSTRRVDSATTRGKLDGLELDRGIPHVEPCAERVPHGESRDADARSGRGANREPVAREALEPRVLERAFRLLEHDPTRAIDDGDAV